MQWPFSHPKHDNCMDNKQRKLMIKRHAHSFQQHGYTPNALFWSSRGIQKIRFKTLAEIGIKENDSLLDVGCGFGDLYGWLKAHALQTHYTGIDLSQDILNKGMELNPKLNLLHGEIFDFDWPNAAFDWVCLSGTLNWNLHDNGKYARQVIQHMFELCSKGVAFNMLNKQYIDHQTMGDLIAYNAQDIFNFCQKISPKCQMRNDYLENDFTIYMKKSE